MRLALACQTFSLVRRHLGSGGIVDSQHHVFLITHYLFAMNLPILL
jgi:hypothetical protein